MGQGYRMAQRWCMRLKGRGAIARWMREVGKQEISEEEVEPTEETQYCQQSVFLLSSSPSETLSIRRGRLCGCVPSHPASCRGLPTFRHTVAFSLSSATVDFSSPSSKTSLESSCKEAPGQRRLLTDPQVHQLPAFSIRSTHRLNCSTRSRVVSFVSPISGDACLPSMIWREMSMQLP